MDEWDDYKQRMTIEEKSETQAGESANTLTPNGVEPHGGDSERPGAKDESEARPEMHGSVHQALPIVQEGTPRDQDPQALRAQTKCGAKPEAEDCEAIKVWNTRELKLVEQLQGRVRLLAVILFALVGFLGMLQLYTQKRLGALMALERQAVAQSAGTQTPAQGKAEKQRAALDQNFQEKGPLGQAFAMSLLPEKEGVERAVAVAVREHPQHIKANKAPRAGYGSAPDTAASQSVDAHDPRRGAREASTMPVLVTRQDAAAIGLDPPATSRDTSSSRPVTPPPPTSQKVISHPGPNEIASQRPKNEGTSRLNLTQPDMAASRDHSKVEKLRELGGRDYIEFTVIRSDSRQEVAPEISLQLRKVDPKRSRCALDVYADDYEFPIDIAVNETVKIPIRAMWESVELGITMVSKDTVVGYLSASKGVLESVK